MNDTTKIEVVRGWQTDAPYDKNSWGTPQYILDAVREAFGGQIDCDPASNAKAQERVRARRWYGEGSEFGADGLDGCADWTGRVFINPPYGKGLILPFVRKLNAMLDQKGGDGSSLLDAYAVLTNLDTSTEWFRELASFSERVVLLGKRVKFIHPETQKPITNQERCQILFVGGDVNLEPLRKLGSVYARA